MSGLVAALTGLAVLLSERAARSASRASVRERAGAIRRPHPRAPRGSRLRAVAVPLAAGGIGVTLGGPVVGALGAASALAMRRVRARRARRAAATARDEQLADAVVAVVSALRAGMSLPQALGYAATESEPPLRDELAEAVRAVDLGIPLAEAIDGWADRVGTDDARLVASTMHLHRRVGGDLPVVLAHVASTVRERVAAAREVRALTAQARLSGGILGALPIGFFAFLWLTSRSEMQAAIVAPAGIAAIVLGLVLDAVAFVWIRKLLEVA